MKKIIPHNRMLRAIIIDLNAALISFSFLNKIARTRKVQKAKERIGRAINEIVERERNIAAI